MPLLSPLLEYICSKRLVLSPTKGCVPSASNCARHIEGLNTYLLPINLTKSYFVILFNIRYSIGH